MKNINESFNDIQNLTEYIKDRNVNEGLRDVLKTLKAKFKQVFQYLKSFVVKAGAYFLPTTDDGKVLPAISPLTAGSAYVEGYINKNSTCVVMDKEGAKITGCKTSFEDTKKLYGPGNSLQYWRRMLNESTNDDMHEFLEKYIAEHQDILSSEDSINEVRLHTTDPEAKYNIIVDDDMLKQRIKVAIKMSLKGIKSGRLMIWGAPGIGKTAILMNVLNEIENNSDFQNTHYKLIVKTLSNETPDNFTLPKYIDVHGDKDMATDVPKSWLPVYKPTGDPAEDKMLSDKCGHGLLFIDELSRATPQVLNVILPLVNEGLINDYKLGDGWTIICASNRDQDEAQGQSEIGNALATRFAQVYYEPCIKTWRKWADQQGYMSPLLLQWLSLPETETKSGGKFYYMDPNDDENRTDDSRADTKLMCTPRSWTNAMQCLAEFSRTGSLEGFSIFDIDKQIIESILNEYVPAVAVDSFMGFLEVVSEIGDFDKVVYDVWQNGGTGLKINKRNLNKVTLPLAQLVCTSHADSLPTKEEWENLCTWLIAQDSDQLASYVLDVFLNVFAGKVEKEVRPALFTIQPRIRKFSSTNPGKLNAIKKELEPALQKWGVAFEDVPDYSEGLNNLIKKYGKSFKSAVVGDHIDALG